MKDFYDLHWLQAHLSFDGKTLTEAISNTFARRDTAIPDEIPVLFTDEFKSDSPKLEQWSAFLRKGKLQRQELPVVLDAIAELLLPVVQNRVSDKVWNPTDKWNSPSRSS